MKYFRLILGCALACVVVGCATQRSGDAAIASQGRRDYELQKYRDPATGRIPQDIRQREQEFGRTLHLHSKTEELLQAESWQARGPWNVGGRTRAVALDVNNENIIVAGGVSGGVWRSEDAGATWTKTTRSDQQHSVTCIVQDTRPGHTSDWYMGTGEVYGNSADISGNGVWKSTDGARSWAPIPTTVSPALYANHEFSYAWRILVHPTPDRTVLFFASVFRGIMRSVDGGVTWTRVLPSNSLFSDVIITSDSTIYATLSSHDGTSNGVATRSGVFMSVDQGATWKDITPSDLKRPFSRIVLGTVPQNPKQFYALAHTPGSGTKSLFILRDGTREEWNSMWKRSDTTWTNLSANIPLFGGRNGDFFTQGSYDMFVKVSPIDSNLVFIGGTNLYRSTDGFRSNTKSAWIGGYGAPNPNELFPSRLNHHPDQHDLIFLPSNNNVIISANDGGVMRSDAGTADTVAWRELNLGYLTTQFYTIAIVDKAGDEQIMGGMQDNGTWATRSTQVQDFWTRRNGGDGSFCAFADSGRTLVVSTQSGRVRRVLVDNAGTELARTRIDPIGAQDYLFINPLTLDKRNENILYLPAGAMLWRNNNIAGIPLGSDDSTTVNWDSLPATKLTQGSISFVLSSAVEERILYYGTTTGRVFRLVGAHVGNPTPQELTAPSMPKGAWVSSIVEDPSDPSHLLVCFSNYNIVSIFSTTDGGNSWQAVAGNLEESPNGSGNGPAVNSVSIMPYTTDTKLYVAATTIGMFFTTQLNGQSTIWTPTAADVIGNIPCDMVLTRASDKRIFVGSHGNGVFSGSIASLPSETTPVTLANPPDNTRGVLSDTTLSWNASPDALLYTLELAESPDFVTGYRTFEGIKNTSQKVTDLTQGIKPYYWRVVAFGVGGRSAASAVWSFTTAILPPVLVSPISGDSGIAGNPVKLTWNAVPGAVSYDIQMSTNLNFNPVTVLQADIADTTTMVNGLASLRRYYWKARSRDVDAAGLYSNRTSFVTGTLTTVEGLPEVDTREASITPNPVHDNAVLSFLPWTSGTIMLTVVNDQGKLAHVYADVVVEATPATINLDCSMLPNGAYTLTITQGRHQIGVPLRIVR